MMPGRMALQRMPDGAELAREVHGHAVHGALGGDVGGPERHPHPRGRARDVDDRARALRLHHRHGPLDALEHAVEVDVDYPLPLVVLDLLHRRARAADAGVVHQHVEPAEGREPLLEPARDGRGRAHVRDAAGHAGVRAEHIRQALIGDAADVDAGAGGVEALGHGAADAAAGAGDHHGLWGIARHGGLLVSLG